MDRDEEMQTERKRPRESGWEPQEKSGLPEYLESGRRVRPQTRPILRPGPMRPQSAPRPLQISSGTRRTPSYPAWERPPSAFDYPRLRGQNVHRPLKPLLIAAVGVALIAGLVLAYSALSGRGGVAVASGSARATGSQSTSVSPSGADASASEAVVSTPTPSPGPPRPTGSFEQYLVKAGDNATKIAIRFGLKTWELLAANPQLTAPNYYVRVDSYLNIPLPGQMAPPTPTPEPTPTPTPSPTVAAP